MHKFSFGIAVLGLLLMPFVSSAHETRMYEISGVPYEIVVGSIGEPVIVDDKTGVEMEIVRNGVPVSGAQETLQVELSAGDAKKMVSLSPVYGVEGKYKSNFIATVPTTLTYRLLGTLENTPIDIAFTCNPAGHPAAAEMTEEVEIGENIVQTLKRGSFGCPQPKEDFGFPEPAMSALALQKSATDVPEAGSSTQDTLTAVALIVSLLGGAVAVAAYTKKK